MQAEILGFLQQVEAERRRRAADPALEARVQAVKSYQQARFSRSYADLLASTRYAGAARFFLEELYGPGDFSERDAQFARVVPALTRLFPAEVVKTVRLLAELHAISEQLDSAMAGQLAAPQLSAQGYVRAWQAVAQPRYRQQQIDLTMAIGAALDGYTRKPLLRQALRMMRGPASAAGLSALQHFLETGFDTFKAMKGSGEFLACVRKREEAFARALFGADAGALELSRPACPTGDDPLGQLP